VKNSFKHFQSYPDTFKENYNTCSHYARRDGTFGSNNLNPSARNKYYIVDNELCCRPYFRSGGFPSEVRFIKDSIRERMYEE